MEHEQIVKKTALKVSLPVSVIDNIIKDSLKNATRVLSHTDIGEVEIAGLGKFTISETKIRKRLDKYYNIKQRLEESLSLHLSSIEVLDEYELRKINKKIRSITNDISNLEKKYLRLQN